MPAYGRGVVRGRGLARIRSARQHEFSVEKAAGVSFPQITVSDIISLETSNFDPDMAQIGVGLPRIILSCGKRAADLASS
jgi:hypothetical protein